MDSFADPFAVAWSHNRRLSKLSRTLRRSCVRVCSSRWCGSMLPVGGPRRWPQRRHTVADHSGYCTSCSSRDSILNSIRSNSPQFPRITACRGSDERFVRATARLEMCYTVSVAYPRPFCGPCPAHGSRFSPAPAVSALIAGPTSPLSDARRPTVIDRDQLHYAWRVARPQFPLHDYSMIHVQSVGSVGQSVERCPALSPLQPSLPQRRPPRRLVSTSETFPPR